MISLLLSAALAGGLPSLDQPLKTGNTASADTAVVIGVEDYAFAPDVPYAERDASAFYDLLVYTVGVPASRIRLFDKGASKEQIVDAVRTAGSDVGAGGTVWIYFAGHGAADPSTGGRLLLGDDVKQDPTAFAARGVGVDELKALAEVKGGAVNLVVDACYSGLGRGGDELIAGKRFLVPAYAQAPKPGVFEWNAASGDELSGPLHPTRHGAFTYLAVGALRGWADGQLDGQRDGKVTAEEAHLYVKDALKTLQINDQTPEMAVDGAKSRVLVKAEGLEPAPTLDPRMAEGGAPDSGPAPYSKPSGPIEAADRPLVESLVRGAVAKCVAEHGGGDPVFDRWFVRFKIKPGGSLKGYLASNAVYTESPAMFPTHTCVREEIKSWSWAATSLVTFKTSITLESSAPAAAPTPAPAPATSPAPAPASATSTTSVSSGTTGGTTTVDMQVPGMGVHMEVTESGDGITVDQLVDPNYAAPTTTANAGHGTPAVGPSSVKLVLRSQDGEWIDLKVDGKVVGELRNDDELVITISPGVHTLEFVDFMGKEPYARGQLYTHDQAEIVFGVKETAVEAYGAADWRAQ
ncbi:MAG: hypothetical protein EP330_22270 [Deltaproteobacteria bacterium]|nr:MAG: hypothetical protein EP330_22270 [Deltaproteobacteria bacterium]